MRAVCLAAAAGLSIAAADVAFAQTADHALTPAEVALGCAPPASVDIPAGAPQVLGAQGTQARTVYGVGDLLILGGGTSNGVQLGSQYFIRRGLYSGWNSRRQPQSMVTLGWLRVVAVNETTAVASIDRMCGAIFKGDYLEPFVAPVLPVVDDAPGDLDFANLGRVASGSENRLSSGAGDVILIDRGTDQGVAPGWRFALYRDMRSSGVPLVSVGDGVVLTAGKTTAVARVTRSRDAVVPGDYVVPRK